MSLVILTVYEPLTVKRSLAKLINALIKQRFQSFLSPCPNMIDERR